MGLHEPCAHGCHREERRGIRAKRRLGVQAAFCWGPASVGQRARIQEVPEGHRAPKMGQPGGRGAASGWHR